MGLHIYPHWGLWFSYSVQYCKYLLPVLTQYSCAHNAHTNSLTRSFPRCYQNDITCTLDLVIHLLKTIQQLSVAHTVRVWILYPKCKPKQVKSFFLQRFQRHLLSRLPFPCAIPATAHTLYGSVSLNYGLMVPRAIFLLLLLSQLPWSLPCPKCAFLRTTCALF